MVLYPRRPFHHKNRMGIYYVPFFSGYLPQSSLNFFPPYHPCHIIFSTSWYAFSHYSLPAILNTSLICCYSQCPAISLSTFSTYFRPRCTSISSPLHCSYTLHIIPLFSDLFSSLSPSYTFHLTPFQTGASLPMHFNLVHYSLLSFLLPNFQLYVPPTHPPKKVYALSSLIFPILNLERLF